MINHPGECYEPMLLRNINVTKHHSSMITIIKRNHHWNAMTNAHTPDGYRWSTRMITLRHYITNAMHHAPDLTRVMIHQTSHWMHRRFTAQRGAAEALPFPVFLAEPRRGGGPGSRWNSKGHVVDMAKWWSNAGEIAVELWLNCVKFWSNDGQMVVHTS